MFNAFHYSKIKRFFYEILSIIEDTEKDVIEIWCDPSDLNTIKKLDKIERNNFLFNFDFVLKSKGNYITINKISFILDCMKYFNMDLKNLSEILDYKGFEALIYEILLRNSYFATKNFRFSDKSNLKKETLQGRYEIDVIGIYQRYILLIDAKQWRRKDSFSSINKAANLQYQRVLALKNNLNVFSDLIYKLLGYKPNIKKILPFVLVPIIVTLEENGNRLNDNQIPLVSIYKLNSFLQEYEKYLSYYKTIIISREIDFYGSKSLRNFI
ncbi:MAG: hypothetical protein ACTSQJ_04880 [Promethearchaeota archaeon]